MNYTFAIISMVGFIIAGATAVFILARNPRELQNRLFFVYASAVAFFNLSDFLTMITPSQTKADIYGHLSSFFWLVFITVLLHFCLVLSKNYSSTVKWGVLPLVYGSALFTLAVEWFTHWFFLPPIKSDYGFMSPMGEYNWIFVLYSISIVLAQIWLLRTALDQQRAERGKIQVRVILTGLITIFFIGTSFDVFLPAFGFYIHSFVPFATTLYVIFFGYAVARYGLLVITPAGLANNILRTMPDLMCFTSQDSTIKMCNQKLLDVLGYKMEEITGKPCEILHADKANHDRVHALAEESESFEGRKAVLLKKDGSRLPVNVSASLVRDSFGDEIGTIFIFHDISNEEKLIGEQQAAIRDLNKNKERMLSILEDTTAGRDEAKSKAVELAKAIEELKGMDEMKTEFLSVISHELKTPLTPIIIYASMFASEDFGKLGENYLKGARVIIKESEHLKSLIDSVLDVSRIERGKYSELKKGPLSLKTMINDLLEVMGPQFESKQINFTAEAPDDLPVLMADADKIRRLLSNLLGNAYKFTPKLGKIKLIGSCEGDMVKVQVIDAGIGIEKENLEKIFTKFFQADSSFTREVGGMGLGLAIAKEIVDAHKGRIWAESEGLGRGARIVFTLPIV